MNQNFLQQWIMPSYLSVHQAHELAVLILCLLFCVFWFLLRSVQMQVVVFNFLCLLGYQIDVRYKNWRRIAESNLLYGFSEVSGFWFLCMWGKILKIYSSKELSLASPSLVWVCEYWWVLVRSTLAFCVLL